MIKQVLVLGAATLVFAAAVIVNLWIVDVVTISALKESLGRISSVVVITTTATVLIIGLARLAMGRGSSGPSDESLPPEPH
jgi:hypothetical protein